MKDKIYNILQVITIIIVIYAIIMMLLFFWMIYRLATYDHCRDINFTEPICEKYRNFWKEKTEMKNLIDYIYIYILRKRGGTTLIVPSQNWKEVEVI